MPALPEFEEQHPIPQQISSYHFRLVGNMTIKQFAQLAAGSIVSLIVYSSSLPFFVKWPMVLFFFLFGVALAFLPIQDRPLEKWIIAFFRSIYSPTLYTWQPISPKVQYFQPEEGLVAMPSPATTQVTQKPQGKTTTKQDVAVSVKPVPGTGATPKKTGKIAVPQAKPATIKAVKLPEIQEEPVGIKIEYSPVLKSLEEHEKEFLQKVEQVSKELEIPKQKPVSVKHTATSLGKIAIKEVGEAEESAARAVTRVAAPVFGRSASTVSRSADFSKLAAPPIAPSGPNLITGQVLDPDGGIVEAAILEVRDEDNRPARAFKSNRLGHFMIATPLVNGKYTLTTEKEGFLFDPVSFEANGRIIPPFAIKAKKKVNSQETKTDDRLSFTNPPGQGGQNNSEPFNN